MASVFSRIVRPVVLTAAVVAAAGFLSSCGGSPSPDATGSSSATSTNVVEHNADDVAFARKMIPHHQQAIELAQMAPENTNNPQLRALAEKIANQQTPEITALRFFLMQWGESPHGGGHGGMDMAGMVDQTTLDQLRALRGAEFDRLWLQSMIAHHEGAIEMAQAENENGQNPDAIYLANSIITAQQAEIDQMKQMLGE